jgi:hypothetical protein
VSLAAVEPAPAETGEDSSNQSECTDDVASVALAEQGASPFGSNPLLALVVGLRTLFGRPWFEGSQTVPV